MLVDANLLLYAANRSSTQHEAASAWLTEQLNGPRRVGLPWQSLGAFLRMATHPRVFERPLSPTVAWDRIRDWLAAPVAWIPQPGSEHAHVLGDLIVRYEIGADLVVDAQLAALALEYGLTLYSADTDFARFSELSWTNPLV